MRFRHSEKLQHLPFEGTVNFGHRQRIPRLFWAEKSRMLLQSHSRIRPCHPRFRRPPVKRGAANRFRPTDCQQLRGKAQRDLRTANFARISPIGERRLAACRFPLPDKMNLRQFDLPQSYETKVTGTKSGSALGGVGQLCRRGSVAGSSYSDLFPCVCAEHGRIVQASGHGL